MNVANVAAGEIVPAAGRVDQSRRIVLLDKLDDPLCVELSPAFVEGDQSTMRRKESPPSIRSQQFVLDSPRPIQASSTLPRSAGHSLVAARHVSETTQAPSLSHQ